MKVKRLPAWAYVDEQGKAKLFVVPFMQDLSELSGLVYLPGGQEGRTMSPMDSKISVYFMVKPKGNTDLKSTAGDIADALGGGNGEGPVIQDVRVLNTSLPLDQLGMDALDLRVAGGSGLYTAVLENQMLQIPGQSSVDTSKKEIVGLRVEVQLPQKESCS